MSTAVMTEEATTMRITTDNEAGELRPVVGSRVVHEIRRHLHRGHQVWFIPCEDALPETIELTPGERDFCQREFASGKRSVWVFRLGDAEIKEIHSRCMTGHWGEGGG